METVSGALGYLSLARFDLPRGLQRVGSEVRDAIGTAFGAPGGARWSPEFWELPLEAHDPEWAKNAWEYIEYAQEELARWRSSKTRAERASMMSYDQWLRLRGRVGVAEN